MCKINRKNGITYHLLVQEMEFIVSLRDMKRHGWTINSNIYIPCIYLHNIKIQVYMYMVKLESIGPITCYICQGYGGHGVMEGYGEKWMENE